MRLVRRLVAVLAATTAASALAQSAPRSLDFERLQLDPGFGGSLVVGTGEIPRQGSFRLSFAGQREHLPLVRVGAADVLGRRDDSLSAHIVENRDTVYGTLDIVILPRVEAYGRAAFVISQDYGTALPPLGGAGADTSGWGSPSFGLRLGALQESAGAPLNVALAGEFFPPWGSDRVLGKRADPAGLVKLEISRSIGAAVLGVEGGYFMQDQHLIGTRVMGSEAQYGVVLAGRKGVVRPEVSYRGAYGVVGDKGPASGELLGGLRLVGGPFEVFGLGGPGFFNRYGTPQWRGLAGIALRYDNVEKKEAPPPPPPPPPPAAKPPPPPPPPDPCAPGQTHTPEQCPDLDDDGDGVLNKDDACPTEKGLPELKGCPAKDSDGDGVPDHLDKCPNEAGPADNQGCPRVVIQKEARKVELREKVQFETGKATIRSQSDPLLDEIAKVMNDHPEIRKVVIEGHTDSTGGAALNRKLSQARAAAVMKALVARGVDQARLSAKGFGPSRPIADNKTVAGREANRRVEISIAEQAP